jgi:hypothetical protein
MTRDPEAWATLPILEQVAGLRIDDAMIAAVVGVLASSERPVTLDRARLERRLRDLVLEHVGGKVTDETYLARVSAYGRAGSSRSRGRGPGVKPRGRMAPDVRPDVA